MHLNIPESPYTSFGNKQISKQEIGSSLGSLSYELSLQLWWQATVTQNKIKKPSQMTFKVVNASWKAIIYDM